MRRVLLALGLLLAFAGSAFATVTWDPANNGNTLTNGNLTITGLATGGWAVTRSTNSYSNGKYYAELTITTNNTSSYGSWGVGVVNASYVATNYMGQVNTSSFGYMPNNGSLLGNPGGAIQTCAVGNKVQVAVDYGLRLMWVQCNGTGGWNVGFSGTQNPSTEQGGIDISNGAVAGAPYFLAWESDNVSPAGSTTTNFGSTAFTYTVPTGFAGYNSSGGTIAISPSTVVGGSTGNVITVTGTSTAFTGTPFAIANGGFGAITAQSTSSSTAGSVTVNPGLYGFGNVILIDTISGAEATLAVTAPSLGTLNYGVIGDSISAGTNGSPVAAETAYLNGLGYTATAYNQAISGTSTQDWVSGSANMNAALTAFSAHLTTGNLVQVMLGTNDTRTPYNFTVAYHTAEMTSVVAALTGAGYQVIIHKPTYTMPNAPLGGYIWSNDPNTTYAQYYASDVRALVNGVNIFQGDSGAFEVSMSAPTTWLAGDGIHPQNATENNILGVLWGIAYQFRWGNGAGGRAIIGGQLQPFNPAKIREAAIQRVLNSRSP